MKTDFFSKVVLPIIVICCAFVFLTILVVNELKKPNTVVGKIQVSWATFYKGQRNCLDTPEDGSLCLTFGGLADANNFVINRHFYSNDSNRVLYFPMIEEEIILFHSRDGKSVPAKLIILEINDDFIILEFAGYVDDLQGYLEEKWAPLPRSEDDELKNAFPPKDEWIFDNRWPDDWNKVDFQNT